MPSLTRTEKPDTAMYAVLDKFIRKIAAGRIVWTLLATNIVVFCLVFYFANGHLFYMVPTLDYQSEYGPWGAGTAHEIISYLYVIGLTNQYIAYEIGFRMLFPLLTALVLVGYIYHVGHRLIPTRILLVVALSLPLITLLLQEARAVGILTLVYRDIEFYSNPAGLNGIAQLTSSLSAWADQMEQTEICVFLAGLLVYFTKRIGFPDLERI